MSFDEIMAMFTNGCHFVVIHRNGFKTENNPMDHEYCGEIGFSTMIGVSYYLWIWLTEEKLETIIKKYDLKELK